MLQGERADKSGHTMPCLRENVLPYQSVETKANTLINRYIFYY
jgi:hypothetical protein